MAAAIFPRVYLLAWSRLTDYESERGTTRSLTVFADTWHLNPHTDPFLLTAGRDANRSVRTPAREAEDGARRDKKRAS